MHTNYKYYRTKEDNMKIAGVLKDGFVLNERVNIGVLLPATDFRKYRDINAFLESLKGHKVTLTVEKVD